MPMSVSRAPLPASFQPMAPMASRPAHVIGGTPEVSNVAFQGTPARMTPSPTCISSSAHPPQRVLVNAPRSVSRPDPSGSISINTIPTPLQAPRGPVQSVDTSWSPMQRELQDILRSMAQSRSCKSILERVEQLEHTVFHRLDALERLLPESLGRHGYEHGNGTPNCEGVSLSRLCEESLPGTRSPGVPGVESPGVPFGTRAFPTHFAAQMTTPQVFPNVTTPSSANLESAILDSHILPTNDLETSKVSDSANSVTPMSLDGRTIIITAVKSRLEDGLGLDVRNVDGHLYVESILENGALDQANKLEKSVQASASILEIGDVIFRVNDVEIGDNEDSYERLVAECQRTTEITIHALRL